MFIKVSKKLLSVATIPLALSVFTSLAEAQQVITVPSCYISGPSGQAANVALQPDSMCIDDRGKVMVIAKKKECKASDARSIVDFNRCLTGATKSDYARYFTISQATFKVCASDNSTNCCPSQNNPNSTTGGTGTGVSGTGNVIVVNGPVTVTGASTRVRYRDPRAQAQYEFDVLYDFCNNYVNDAITSKADDLDSAKKKRDDLQTSIPDLEKAVKDAKAKMASSCRKDCVQIAIDPKSYDLPAECGLAKDKLALLLDGDDFKPTNDNGRTNPASTGALDKLYPKGQDPLRAQIEKQPAQSLANVCSVLISDRNKACTDAVKKAAKIGDCGFGMETDPVADYLAAEAALVKAKSDLAVAVANVDTLGKADSTCVVRSANDCIRMRDKAGPDCLTKASDSCAKALADANQQLQIILRTPYCATCGYNGLDNGVCGYGAGCGVSRWAANAQALGSIGVPLALGIMNMAMWNKGVNACISMNSQAFDVSRTVGLPPPGPSCGGMGGFGGGFMGGGAGGMFGPSLYGPGMNPFAMGGIGGGLMGGGNPWLSGGINAGINFGMGNPYAAMGGGMYNPMMMGAGGMYNPMAMGQMGGVYGNPMMMGQGNVYGVQQQMYDAQMRMQQMAAQNMVLQQSSMMGGMYGQMGGAYGYMNSPYYNMGFQGGVNPYMNMGATGMFNLNPWAYASNPYAYAGGLAGGGIQGGISGGISAGFNTGFNTAYNPYSYAYGGMPSLATPPYVGGNYGYNAGAGYGPYGNTGIYPSYNTGCGWQVGTPCGGI